jgi:hypothetical protein
MNPASRSASRMPSRNRSRVPTLPSRLPINPLSPPHLRQGLIRNRSRVPTLPSRLPINPLSPPHLRQGLIRTGQMKIELARLAQQLGHPIDLWPNEAIHG